jgi:antitoxin MazE
MKVQIAKWGNSAAVRLPKALLQQAGLAEGSDVEMTVKDGVLVIAALESQTTLADLIRSMDEVGPEGQSESIDWGPDRGSEVIDDAYSAAAVPRTKGKAKRAS